MTENSLASHNEMGRERRRCLHRAVNETEQLDLDFTAKPQVCISVATKKGTSIVKACCVFKSRHNGVAQNALSREVQDLFGNPGP